MLLVNLGAEPYVVQPGDRIAQLVIAPVVIAELEEAESLADSVRGDGGFGHTGARPSPLLRLHGLPGSAVNNYSRHGIAATQG